MDMKYKPSRKKSVIAKELDHRLILYNPDAKEIYLLNDSASLVWKLCDGGFTIEKIADATAQKYDLSSRLEIQGDIVEIVGDFKKEGLVEA